MSSWILTWVAYSIMIAPCTPTMPTSYIDQYGIVRDAFSTTLLACFSTESREMSTRFDSLENATDFISELEKEKCKEIHLPPGCVDNIKLEEVTK